MSISQYDIWNRAETGEICPLKEFEYKRMFPNVQKLVKKYNIEYDRNLNSRG